MGNFVYMWSSIINTVLLCIIILLILPKLIANLRMGRNATAEYIHTLGSNISMELSPLAHIVIDSFNNVIFLNPATEMLFELKEADVLNKPANLIIGHIIDLKTLSKHTDNNESEEMTIMTRITNRKVCVEVMAWRWKEKNGKMQFYTCVVKDVSHRKLNEETQRKLNAYVADLKNIYKISEKIAHMGIWKWDLETDTVAVTEGFNTIFGVKGDSFSSTELFDRINESDVVNIRKSVENALETRTGYQINYTITRLNNHKVPIHSIAEVQTNDKGEPISITGIIRDTRYY